MPGPRHAYFAYGSNLCVRQMAQRCPDATDPQAGILGNHDWLINQRGVATIEPFTGNHVHGVIWQISDDDLATLDSAEGVPVRYGRDQLTVQTDDGPSPAWVYIDHRVDPGAPRPGYLERIIAGATHHRLPQRWIDFLRRWDPTHWPHPMRLTRSLAPQSFSELLSQPRMLKTSRLQPRFDFPPVHVGNLKQITDVIGERSAEATDTLTYLLRHPDHYPHHPSSARFHRDDRG